MGSGAAASAALGKRSGVGRGPGRRGGAGLGARRGPEQAPLAPEPLREPAEDLALALEWETVEHLEVIANLELLETIVALEEGAG